MEYSRIESVDTEGDECVLLKSTTAPEPPQYPSTRLRRAFAVLSVVILAIITATVFIYIDSTTKAKTEPKSAAPDVKTLVSSPTKTNQKPHPCGTTSAEARALGCKFHQLTWSWLPPDCPTYANEEFMAAAERPWVFYQDLGASKVADGDAWEEVLNGERRVFGERREHVTHCIFMFLSLAKIIRDGTPYHESLGEYKHFKHCTNMLLDIARNSSGWNEVDTISGTVSFDQSCDISGP